MVGLSPLLNVPPIAAETMGAAKNPITLSVYCFTGACLPLVLPKAFSPRGKHNMTDETPGTPRRIDVELFIVHPSFTPEQISAALGMEGHITQCVGKQRQNSRGTLLPGAYRDTRWRHSIRHVSSEQWFAAEIASFVEGLERHKAYFSKIRATGGEVSVIIQFFNDGYLGDEISVATLAKLADLGLPLGIECFT